MEKNSNRFFTEEESRKSTRRWLYVITCWILIFVFIVFGGHTGDGEGIPMKKTGSDGVKLDMHSGMSVQNDNPAVNPGDTEFSIETVTYNDDDSRKGEEIAQPDVQQVLEAIEQIEEVEEPKDEEPAKEVAVIEDSEAGTVVEAVEVGGSTEVDPTVETAAGDWVLSDNIDWTNTD